MCTGEIPTTDKIPEKTEKLGCPTDNIPDNLHLFLFQIDMIKLSVLKNRLSGILSVVWVSHPYPYPYPRKFSCSCMEGDYIKIVRLTVKVFQRMPYIVLIMKVIGKLNKRHSKGI